MITSNLNTIPNILYDLIQINEDRALIYTQAAQQVVDDDDSLARIFHWFAGESKQFVRELNSASQYVNGQQFREHSLNGKIYSMWMEVKSTFDQTRLRDLFQLCEYCENAVVNAYHSVLSDPDFVNTAFSEIRSLIKEQQGKLNYSHQLITALQED